VVNFAAKLAEEDGLQTFTEGIFIDIAFAP
jgi:hypothetical protein